MAGKATGRTRACGRPATFTDARLARLWARVSANATGTSWTVVWDEAEQGWRAAPDREAVAK